MRDELPFWSVFLLPLALCFAGCAEIPSEEACGQECHTVENLLDDIFFEQTSKAGGPWVYSQHSGEDSFALSSNSGVLEIRRVASEPWMILRQTYVSNDISGCIVQFSAELKGNAPPEPRLHGFEHKAGLYLNIGDRRDPITADHEPNSGVWDWQTASVERMVPEGESRVHVGFLHQSGGILWVRNPMLTISDCDP